MRRDLKLGGTDHGRVLEIRSWVLAISTVLAIVIGAVLGAPANAAANPAEQFVQQKVDTGYQILNNSGLSATARRAQFRQFLTELTDLKRIAAFTLGVAGRSTSDADKEAFYKAFQDYAVAVYDVHLSKYRGQTLKVTGSLERAADDVVVNAQVVDPNKPNAAPIKVAFRVRGSGGGLTVTDLQVEGVWLSISERADFQAYLQQHGNDVKALTAHLEQMAKKIDASGAVVHDGSDDDD